MSMEFRLTTDLDTALPAEISFNSEEIEAWLTERLDHYTHLVVTEDTIRESKDDIARLRKLRDAIDTRRKDVKKQWMAPYTAFETQVKRLTALIDKPILAIDGQLKGFEEQRKEEKRQQISAVYDETVPHELKSIITLDRIMDPKWLNATVSMKKVSEAMADIVKRTQADMLILDTVEPEFKAAVLDHYMRTRDVMAALQYKQSMMAAQEAARKREEAKAEQVAAEQVKAATEPAREAEKVPETEPAQAEPVYVLRLELHLTQAQSRALKQFLVDNGIDHMKI